MGPLRMLFCCQPQVTGSRILPGLFSVAAVCSGLFPWGCRRFSFKVRDICLGNLAKDGLHHDAQTFQL